MLEELRAQLHHTVAIAVLDGREVVLIDYLRGFRGHARLNLDLGSSSRLPAYCTSMGKLLLASLPDQQQDEIVKRLVLRKRGPNSIRSRSLLRAELEVIREFGGGYAVCDEELKAGVRSIAFPVVAATGEVVAAVNVFVPTDMISSAELVSDFGPKVAATAERISVALSRPDDNQKAVDETSCPDPR
jgi:IclR family pca regulon transcriptional regulator